MSEAREHLFGKLGRPADGGPGFCNVACNRARAWAHAARPRARRQLPHRPQRYLRTVSTPDTPAGSVYR